MPISFDCACGRTLRVPDESAGQLAKCPGCGGVTIAPGGEPEPEEEEIELEEDEAVVAARRKAKEEEEEAERRQKPKRRYSSYRRPRPIPDDGMGTVQQWVYIIGGVVLLLFGGILLLVGWIVGDHRRAVPIISGIGLIMLGIGSIFRGATSNYEES